MVKEEPDCHHDDDDNKKKAKPEAHVDKLKNKGSSEANDSSVKDVKDPDAAEASGEDCKCKEKQEEEKKDGKKEVKKEERSEKDKEVRGKKEEEKKEEEKKTACTRCLQRSVVVKVDDDCQTPLSEIMEVFVRSFALRYGLIEHDVPVKTVGSRSALVYLATPAQGLLLNTSFVSFHSFFVYVFMFLHLL